MKKTITILLAIALFSCNTTKDSKATNPAYPKGKFIGIIKLNGKKQIAEVYREIGDGIKYDSAKGMKLIVTDTAYGVRLPFYIPDSTGKALKTAEGKDSIRVLMQPLRKDSVWLLSEIPIDTLIKNKP